jgi:hypothetical protein
VIRRCLVFENPSIDIGVRGLSYIEVEVTGPNRDLHRVFMAGLLQIQLLFWQK